MLRVAGALNHSPAGAPSIHVRCTQACPPTAAATPCPAGGTALSRPLILALEAYGGQAAYQGALLSRVAAILAAPPARQLAAPRGGDADPEAAQALLSLLGCCLRQAAGWRAVPQPAAVEAVLRWGLPLAAANTACHHRDTSLQAVGTLAALLALVLAADSPLHGALLGFAAQQGPALVQGLLLALLSLSSGSSLPKVGVQAGQARLINQMVSLGRCCFWFLVALAYAHWLGLARVQCQAA